MKKLIEIDVNDNEFISGVVIACPGGAYTKDEDFRVIDPAQEWRPIESAPRNGDYFLAFEHGYGIQETKWYASHDGGAGGFRNPHHGWSPTHWMPLPAAPEGL